MIRALIAMTVACAAITSGTHAEDRASRTSAFLWIENVECIGDVGGDGWELRIQASYYDSNQNRLHMPIFVQYSPSPQSPWAFSINRSTCTNLRRQLGHLSEQLIPVDILRVEGQGVRRTRTPCGLRNPRTGESPTCARTEPVDTVYIQHEVNGLLFTSWAQR